MRKLVALALSCAMVFSMTACGSKDNGSKDNGSKSDSGKTTFTVGFDGYRGVPRNAQGPRRADRLARGERPGTARGRQPSDSGRQGLCERHGSHDASRGRGSL